MKKSEVLQAWAGILVGRAPSLSIEITKECPLRCPGCYAFDAAHLGGATQLRELSDFKGEELVRRVLAIVDEYKPLHVSLVGGDPLVRYREVEALLPELERRGVHTQVVTSAFREIPSAWRRFKKLNVVVSVDGLQAEHDARRKPATYERILKSIHDARVTIHCTITSQIAVRGGYLDEFLAFWSAQAEVVKVWFSLDGISAKQPGRVHLRADHHNHLSRFENADHALPVWGRAGLQTVRMHCVNGAGRGGPLSRGGAAHRRASVLGFGSHWQELAAASGGCAGEGCAFTEGIRLQHSRAADF